MLKLTTLLALFAFAPVVNAAPPSAESIDALLAATKAERNVDTMLANLDPIMRQSMTTVTKGQQLSAEQLRELDAARVRTIQAIREEMAWDRRRVCRQDACGHAEVHVHHAIAYGTDDGANEGCR